MNRFCNACNIEIYVNGYLKDRIVCKNCSKKNRRKNNINNNLIQNEQPKIDDNNKNDNNPSVAAHENHRHVIIRPSNVAKTYYMFKIFEKIDRKNVFI